jgi:excinuclease ABC subunit A
VIDRFTWRADETERLADSAAQAFRRGEGRLELIVGSRAVEKRSERWECSHCGAPAMRPEPALFSFNSPLGVCPECRGFGNVLTFMPELVIPDPTKTLKNDAIRPWAGSWRKVFRPKLEKFAREQGIAMDVPWNKLPAAQRKLLLEGAEASAA